MKPFALYVWLHLQIPQIEQNKFKVFHEKIVSSVYKVQSTILPRVLDGS